MTPQFHFFVCNQENENLSSQKGLYKNSHSSLTDYEQNWDKSNFTVPLTGKWIRKARLYTMEYLSIKRKEVLGRKSNMDEYKYCAANCVIV